MGFNDQMSDAVSVFFMSGGHGETVTYRAVAAVTGESIEAIAEDIAEPITTGGGLDSEMVPSMSDAIRFYIDPSEVAEPAYGDEITRGGTVWRVRQVLTQEGLHVLYCVGEERMSG